MSNNENLPKVERENIFVDPEVVHSIYEDLEKLTITLDENPIQFGPRRLNAKVAQTRNMLTKCDKLYMQISKFLWQVKSSINRDETMLQMKTNDLLANDPDVRARPSVSDRKAMVQVRLQEEIEILEEKKENFVTLQMLLDTLKAKKNDLIDTQTRLNSQIRLCKMEIENLGVKWGSKDPEATLNLPQITGIDGFLGLDEEEIEELLEEDPPLNPKVKVPSSFNSITPDSEEIVSEGKLSLKEIAKNSLAMINLEELSAPPSDKEVEGFLEALEEEEEDIEPPKNKKVEEDDLDDILNLL